MKTFAPIVTLALFISAPALAQNMDHSQMQGMSIPPTKSADEVKPAMNSQPKSPPVPQSSVAGSKPTSATARPSDHGDHGKMEMDMSGTMGGDMSDMNHSQMQGESTLPAKSAEESKPSNESKQKSAPTTQRSTGSSKSMSDTATPTDRDGHGNMEMGMPGMAGGDMPGMDHSQMPSETPEEEEVGQEPPPAPPSDHAADVVFGPSVMLSSREQLRKEHGGGTFSKFMLNLGEYQVRDGEDGYRWEGEGWFGGDIHRLVVKSEGEGGTSSGIDDAEMQILYSRAVSPYFDLQAGVRQDFEPTPARTYATLGFEGLAPYWFETQGAVFLSDRGELLGRFEGTYDLNITQRLILQPRIELNLAAENIPEIGIGSGVSNMELGLRLRFEVKREFAPYVGISLDHKFGTTARYARSRGEDVTQPSIVIGIRAWF